MMSRLLYKILIYCFYHSHASHWSLIFVSCLFPSPTSLPPHTFPDAYISNAYPTVPSPDKLSHTNLWDTKSLAVHFSHIVFLTSLNVEPRNQTMIRSIACPQHRMPSITSCTLFTWPRLRHECQLSLFAIGLLQAFVVVHLMLFLLLVQSIQSKV